MAGDATITTTHITNGHTTHDNTHNLFVCGRICLLGEHSDWASTYATTSGWRGGNDSDGGGGGYTSTDTIHNPDITAGRALVAGTQTGLYATVTKLDKHIIELSSTLSTHHTFTCPLTTTAIQPHCTDTHSLYRYGCGVVVVLLHRYSDQLSTHGLRIDNHKTTLPIKKGLSSSAAYAVLICRAFNTAYNLQLTDHDVMHVAYEGERLTGSQCGQLDQVCAIVSSTTLVDATFDQRQLHTTQLTLTNTTVHLVVVDLGAHKETVTILKELNDCYVSDVDSEVSKGVQYMFGRLTQSIVSIAVDILHGADVTDKLSEHEKQCGIDVRAKRADEHVDDNEKCAYYLGRLMTVAQHYFDKYAQPACPSQLTAPVLHKVLNHAGVQQYVFGGKWIGSGGDGSVQLIARNQKCSDALVQLLQSELGMSAMQIKIGKR